MSFHTIGGHLTCVCCSDSVLFHLTCCPRSGGGAGSRRQRGGVFYQRAGDGAERSDETDPSSASPAGNDTDPNSVSPAAADCSHSFCFVRS